MATQYSYHCHLGLASNVSSSVPLSFSLGEINFPLFVERTVGTREDDITGLVLRLRCYRGHNSSGLKQDNALQGGNVRDCTKSDIFNLELSDLFYEARQSQLEYDSEIKSAKIITGGSHCNQILVDNPVWTMEEGAAAGEGRRDITTLRDDEDCS